MIIDLHSQWLSLMFYPVLFLWIKGNNYFFSIFNEKEMINLYSLSIVGGLIFSLTIGKMYLREAYIIAVITYFVFALVIIRKGNNLNWIMLSFPMVIFYSEFYEIPIYLHRIIYGSPYAVDWLNVGVKLSYIIAIMEIVQYYEWDLDYLLNHYSRFIIIYSIFGLIIMPYISGYSWLSWDLLGLRKGILAPLILKFICLVDFIINVIKVEKR